MGVDHYVYLIIGRMCTTEEADRIWNTMQGLDRDFQDWENLTDFETAGQDNFFTVFDNDGRTKWPVVVFTYGTAYSGDFWDRDRDEFRFYVVEHFLYCQSDRWVEEDFVPLRDMPVPHDPRAGLLMIHDLG